MDSVGSKLAGATWVGQKFCPSGRGAAGGGPLPARPGRGRCQRLRSRSLRELAQRAREATGSWKEAASLGERAVLQAVRSQRGRSAGRAGGAVLQTAPAGPTLFPGRRSVVVVGGAGKRPGQRRGFHPPPRPAAARGATAPPTRPRPPSHSRLPTADVRGSRPFALTRGLFKDVQRENVIRSGSWKDQPALRRGRGRGWPERPPVPSFRRVRLCMVTYQT